MKRLKNLFYILLLNIIISSVVTYTILFYWDSRPVEVTQATALVTVLVTIPGAHVTQVPGEPLPSFPIQTIIPVESPFVPTQILTQPYQVQAGDTLSKIALFFKVGMEDILRVNELSDPNSLYAGQILLIPESPLPTYTPDYSPTPSSTITPTPQNTSTPTQTPTRDTSPGRLRIESIQGAGELDSEKAKITHTGGGEVSLEGWRLVDEDGNAYIFPMLLLYPGGSVLVHSKVGTNTVSDLYWGLAQPAWKAGETATLYDAQNNIRATLNLP
jgi:LysM repeat protein